MRVISKVLLFFESIFIAYVSFLGGMIGFGSLIYLLKDYKTIEDVAIFIFGIVILSSIVSGWRIFFWVMLNGPANGRRISKIWWCSAGLGASLTIASLATVLICNLLGWEINNYFVQIFPLGGLFLIPCFHVLYEYRLQKLSMR
ncbi:hypothetical protein [Candidatus Pelagadaptatus aseana]|uniref:hypothetical protein n=1 Tax=Candidatus Pelagadaptatus aseana TaxID=3120508 RepID=UPI003C7024AB